MDVLSLSQFKLVKIADEFEDFRTSRFLGYLSPGQAEMFHISKPWNIGSML